MAETGAQAVEAFISAQDDVWQTTLRQLRAIILSEAPQAEERYAYGIPTFRLHYDLVGIGVTKKACSLYTMNPALVTRLQDELQGVRHSGATIHFDPDEALPEELIRKIVRMRIAENEARAAAKKK